MKTLIKAIDSIFPENVPYDWRIDERTLSVLYKFIALLFDNYFIGREKTRLLEEALGRFEQGVGAENDVVDGEVPVNEA
jgi:hypothetical protein